MEGPGGLSGKARAVSHQAGAANAWIRAWSAAKLRQRCWRAGAWSKSGTFALDQHRCAGCLPPPDCTAHRHYTWVAAAAGQRALHCYLPSAVRPEAWAAPIPFSSGGGVLRRSATGEKTIRRAGRRRSSGLCFCFDNAGARAHGLMRSRWGYGARTCIARTAWELFLRGTLARERPYGCRYC